MQVKVKDVMTANPACCTAESPLQEAAQLMVDFDCGEIPVVQDYESGFPVGVITDRDIVCRAVAKGKNPLEMTVGDCMSTPLIVMTEDATLDECYRVLEENQIRRVPVVDASGSCIGIVSLSDISRSVSRRDSAEILYEISAATGYPSNVGSSPRTSH
jgi:CBS domain-containing protein